MDSDEVTRLRAEVARLRAVIKRNIDGCCGEAEYLCGNCSRAEAALAARQPGVEEKV